MWLYEGLPRSTSDVLADVIVDVSGETDWTGYDGCLKSSMTDFKKKKKSSR